MLLIASQENFSEVVDKATKFELAIRARLVQDALLLLPVPPDKCRERQPSLIQKLMQCKQLRSFGLVKTLVTFCPSHR